MSKTKDIPEKLLFKTLKSNISRVLMLENRESQKYIKDKFPAYKIDPDILVYQTRKILVQNVGLKLIKQYKEKKQKISIDNYKDQINEVENASDLLIYNHAGKNNYERWIEDDIKKLNIVKTVSDDDDRDVSHIKHIIAGIKTEEISREAEKIKQDLELDIDRVKKDLKAREIEIENVSHILKYDNKDIEEFDDGDMGSDNEKYQDWWEKIGLTSNPFNSNGLDKIRKEDYDNILIDNPGIKRAKAFRNIEENSFSLGTNYMILGNLGTGKTAVVDYLKEFSLEQGIESFIVKMPQVYSVDEMSHEFYTIMHLNIRRWLRENNIEKQNIGGSGQSDFILNLDSIINEYQNIDLKGFFIFIEDLHKQKNERIAFEFISTLQSLVENFMSFKINCSIFLTGKPGWTKVVENDPTLTSVISTSEIITLPDVTPAVATRAITKRFEVFRLDKKSKMNKDYKYKLAHNKIKTLANIVDKSKEHTGYRIFFHEIKKDLENGVFDIFDINPLTITEAIKGEYVKLLKNNKKAKKIITNLSNQVIKDSKLPRVKQKTILFGVLSKLLVLGPLSEKHRQMKKRHMKFAIKYLFRPCGAITMNVKNRKWQPVESLIKFHQRLKNELGLGLDYFLSSYHLRKKGTEQSLVPHKEVKKESKEWYFRLSAYKEYLDESGIVSETNAINLIDNIENKVLIPFYEMRKGYENINIEDIQSIIKQVSSIDMESLSKFLKADKDIENKVYYKYDIMEHTKAYFDNFFNVPDQQINNKTFLSVAATLIEELMSEVLARKTILGKINKSSLSNAAQIETSDINRSVQKIIFMNKDSIENEQIISLCDHFQESLRKYLYTVTSLTFGPYHERKKLWGNQIKGSSIDRMMYRLSPTVVSEQIDPNEFDQLNRAEIKEVFVSAGIFQKEVTRPLIDNVGEGILFKGIDQFENINITYSHDKKDDMDIQMKNNPDIIYNMLLIIKSIYTTINEKILETKVNIHGGENDFVCFTNSYTDKQIFPRFNKFKNLQESGVIKKGQINKEHGFDFIDICKDLGIYCWPVSNVCDQLFDAEGNERIVNLTDVNTIAGNFGNMLYGSGIANLFYSIDKDDIICKKLYGSEFLMTTSL